MHIGLNNSHELPKKRKKKFALEISYGIKLSQLSNYTIMINHISSPSHLKLAKIKGKNI
jgi:hypothetical protein